jgi:DNA modification methylase
MTARILVGGCLDVLRTLDAESVQCVVTSPPYWGLRDYGVAGQLGLERTPDEYVEKVVAVFDEARRVLRNDGTLWLNLGDSYANDTKWGGQTGGKHVSALPLHGNAGVGRGKRTTGLKAKDLVGIPWRVAFALQANGWYLRSDIIWHKTNPMPESVDDRPTRAHEYIFLLSKSPRYYYDAAAIKEPVTGGAHARGNGVNPKAKAHGPNSRAAVDRVPRPRPKQNESFSAAVTGLVDERNKRSVWSVATFAYPGAHFATFPPALIEPCVKAGSRAGDTILDPFAGAGTTGLVADRLGRDSLLIELNPAYAEMMRRRITGDAPLFVDLV